jgi:hypothetical protein
VNQKAFTCAFSIPFGNVRNITETAGGFDPRSFGTPNNTFPSSLIYLLELLRIPYFCWEREIVFSIPKNKLSSNDAKLLQSVGIYDLFKNVALTNRCTYKTIFSNYFVLLLTTKYIFTLLPYPICVGYVENKDLQKTTGMTEESRLNSIVVKTLEDYDVIKPLRTEDVNQLTDYGMKYDLRRVDVGDRREGDENLLFPESSASSSAAMPLPIAILPSISVPTSTSENKKDEEIKVVVNFIEEAFEVKDLAQQTFKEHNLIDIFGMSPDPYLQAKVENFITTVCMENMTNRQLLYFKYPSPSYHTVDFKLLQDMLKEEIEYKILFGTYTRDKTYKYNLEKFGSELKTLQERKAHPEAYTKENSMARGKVFNDVKKN